MIKHKRGLDLPLEGKPHSEIETLLDPDRLGLHIPHLNYMRSKLLVSIGDSVKLGQPLFFDKNCPDRKFVSPASGVIEEIQRGEKRCVQTIVIRRASEETLYENDSVHLDQISADELIQFFLKTGLFAHIFQRPFGTLANPQKKPDSIFIQVFDKAPFSPTSYIDIHNAQEEFQNGIHALSKISSRIHVVCDASADNYYFKNLKSCEVHYAKGPYPISNLSVQIQAIDPIVNREKKVWTLHSIDVIRIGHMIQTGKYYTKEFVTLAGPMVLPKNRKHYATRMGIPLIHLLQGRIKPDHSIRLISGNPLTGKKSDLNGYLGLQDHVVSAFEEGEKRRFLHFMRLKNPFYSSTNAYKKTNEDAYVLNTLKHGELRAFIDPNIYDRVTPLQVSTIHFIKSLLAQDYDTSEKMGLFEVVPEDFALASFICPSKIEFMDIVEREIQNYITQNEIE